MQEFKVHLTLHFWKDRIIYFEGDNGVDMLIPNQSKITEGGIG